MTVNEKRRAYQAFFLKSEAGTDFMTHVNDQISRAHAQAEDDPDHSRDYVQRAKGAREVLTHIQSMTAERSKPIA